QQNMNVDLPFMLPIPDQDNAPVKTDLDKWLMVRTVEAWILLKDLTTYLSGPQERKLTEVLEGNVEVSDIFSKILLASNISDHKTFTDEQKKEFVNLVTSRKDQSNKSKEILPISNEDEKPSSTERIFRRKFWVEKFTPAKAKKVVEITNRFSYEEFNDEVLDQVVSETSQRLKEAGDDNVAFFIQTHALLAKNDNSYEELDLHPELKKALKEKQWEHKAALYNYWFEKVEYRRNVETPKVSAIIISNRFKEKSVENLKRLNTQLEGIGEIIFVNNGIDDQEFDPLIEYVDTFVKANGNSGAYLARNLGAIYANGDLLLFVDDDGIPDDGFVKEHLTVHDEMDIIAARGVCYSNESKKKEPQHYNLGSEIISAPTFLEGNTSYNCKEFFNIDGWGDFIMFGHGGMELSYRLLQSIPEVNKQIYFPGAKLNHAYSKGRNQLKAKHHKQSVSFHLLNYKFPDLRNKINSWSDGSAITDKGDTFQNETTPSKIKRVHLNKGKYRALDVYIPEKEVHRISNIFDKNEYQLPKALKLADNSVVLDIGANVGIFALYANQWGSNIKIHCFEPNPQVQPVLEMNTKMFNNIKTHFIALGDKNGELELFQHPINTGQTSTTYRLQGAKIVKVSVRHAGEQVDDMNLRDVDVVKIDTEGAEVSILKGLKKYLPNTKIVMAEYHTEQDRIDIESYLPGFMLYSAQIEELRGVGTVKYINIDYLNSLKK
ncbi:MAG: FkbM family methyltransferase, partial [Psychroflexus sp.]